MTTLPAAAPAWAGLAPDQIEYHYNPRVSVPNVADFDRPREPATARAREELLVGDDVAYGEHPRHRLDIFRARDATTPAPVHLFFHGGYWRANDKQAFGFIGAGLAALGITTVVANYELCPGSTLDGVTESALRAFAWTVRHIADFGGDPRRIGISGHSAGAHLCAAIMSADWAARGLPEAGISGATLVSGAFDPTPAMHTSLNALLRLTPEIAARNNTEAMTPRLQAPVSVVVGGREPAQWIDMSLRYARHLQQHGYDPDVHVLAGYHHFNLLDQYLAPDSVIARAVKAHAA